MSLTASAIFDSLPYIDTEPTPDERAAAQSLITAEMANLSNHVTDTHPALPPYPTLNLSPWALLECERVENKLPLKAIDLSRYESSDLPSLADNDRKTLTDALRSTYISQSYLNNRKKNLESLDEFGKNAWLLGNAQLENILRDIEQALAQKKTEVDICVIQRKYAQEAVQGEIKGLEDTWKKAIGRALETEIAAANLNLGISTSKT